MPGKVKFICDRLAMTATLNSSATAAALFAALPIESLVESGVGYVYFGVPLSLPEEDIKETVSAGVVAYWPAGSCVCLFFGGQPPTGVSIVGSLNGNAMQWRNAMSGTPIRLEKV